MSPSYSMNREQSRAVDRIAIDEYGIPGIVLMENAGREIARWILESEPRGPIVLCCGKGNNGGDGFVIARYLAIERVPVQILLFCSPDRLSGDAAIQWKIVERMKIPTEIIPADEIYEEVLRQCSAAEWVIDAMLGTGLQGPVRTEFATAIHAMNESGRPILAVDLPSGMDCDTGRPLGACVKATRTATMVAPKLGFSSSEAAKYLGEVRVIPIGIPHEIVDHLSTALDA